MKIGQAAAASGISQRMIRHYESIGLVPRPPRLDSNYRDYAPADVHRLRFIANARDLGFPVSDIAALLGLWSDGGRDNAEVRRLALARAAELHRKAVALEAMRKTLVDLAERCEGGSRPDCPILAALEGGESAVMGG